jgi:hypothetical protein
VVVIVRFLLMMGVGMVMIAGARWMAVGLAVGAMQMGVGVCMAMLVFMAVTVFQISMPMAMFVQVSMPVAVGMLVLQSPDLAAVLPA